MSTKQLSRSEQYSLAHLARSKLFSAARCNRKDHDLRILVGHANLLDRVTESLGSETASIEGMSGMKGAVRTGPLGYKRKPNRAHEEVTISGNSNPQRTRQTPLITMDDQPRCLPAYNHEPETSRHTNDDELVTQKSHYVCHLRMEHTASMNEGITSSSHFESRPGKLLAENETITTSFDRGEESLAEEDCLFSLRPIYV